MKKIFIFLSVFLIMATNAISSEKIILAAADPWPPFVDPADPEEGISLKIIRAAYKIHGYSVKMEYVPWARAMHGVKICTYDILPNAWITSEREEVLDFSKPYAANEIVFIKRKNDPFEFNGLESLKGKHVGVVRGYGYNNEFLRATHFTRDESRDFITCIKKLINKRLDLAIEDRIVGRIIMANDNPDYLNRIDFTKNHLSKNELYICVGKNNPRKKEILKAFNEGLMEIKANGTYSKIMESFGLN